MNNFWSWVAPSEEAYDGGPLSSRIDVDLVGSNEKIDLEMGSKDAYNPGVPTILQGMDLSESQ